MWDCENYTKNEINYNVFDATDIWRLGWWFDAISNWDDGLGVKY
jgi:hypothetical protein